MISKPFKTLDNQIDILINKGLVISNKEVTKSILLRENYYNVINGYKDIFLDKSDSSSEKFIENTNFNEIYRLYSLDRDFRNHIFKYLLMFETNLKTIIAYRFAEKFPKKNAYLNANCYTKEPSQLDNVLINMANLSKIIQREKKKKHSNSIKHYLENHSHIPIWVLINNLTFGETSYLFNSLTNDLQEKIAKDFSVKFKIEYNTKDDVSVGALKQIIKAVNFDRNICAHEEVLYSKRIGPLKEKNFKKYYDSAVLNEIKEGSLFGLLAMLKLVLSLEDLNQLLLSLYFPLVINDRLGIFETVPITTIKSKMGFIEDWEYKISNFVETNSGLLKILEDKEEFN